MKKQQGAALIVGLIVLLIMTMLGVSSMGVTNSQLRMASNVQTQQIAFQATETIAAYFRDGSDKENSPFPIDWDLATVQAFNNLDPIGDAKTVTDLQVAYVGCMLVPLNQSLTGSSQDGGSGSYKGLAHDLSIRSGALNSNLDRIGQRNTRVNGVQTIAPDCPVVPTP